MKLCITTPARDQSSSAGIVLCFDYLISDDFTQTDVSRTVDFRFAPGLAAIFVGNREDSVALVRYCKGRIYGPTLDNLKEQLWQGMQDFKEALLRLGNDHCDVQVLVCGFVKNEPTIIHLDERGTIVHQSFVAIGSGAVPAQAMLTWRRVNRETFLDEAVYYVHEAKRIAEAIPSVTKSTSILLLEIRSEEGLSVRALSDDSIEELNNQFDELGPQSYRPQSPFLWKPMM